MKRVVIVSCLVWASVFSLGAKTPDYAQLRAMPLGSIKAQGWLRQQLERSKAGMGGHLDELEPDLIGKPYVTREYKPQWSPGWRAEISGEYWAGLVELAFTLDDAELKAKAKTWVEKFLALQKPDGYLGSYRPDENRQEDYSTWGANWGYRALLSWYSATGDVRVLEAVHKGLLWFTAHWNGDKKTDYAGPILMDSMMAVYQLTGDARLLAWCRGYLDWLDNHDTFFHSPAAFLRPELNYGEVHSVCFMEAVALPALVYAGNNEKRLLDASLNGLRQVKAKCWQCNGSPACNDEHLSPPSANHESEYCVFSTAAATFEQLFRVTGDARYGDDLERLLFNAAQGARKTDERAMAYMSSPNQFFATQSSSLFACGRDMEVYAPNYPVACCPAQSVRIYPEYIRSLFMKDAEGGITVPAYGPCELSLNGDAEQLTVREETLYPFRGDITFRIASAPAAERIFRFKIPGWCEKYSVLLNGHEIVTPAGKGSFLTLRKAWSNDVVSFSFDMKPRVMPVKDIYFPNEPLRTVESGPLLYVVQIPTVWTPCKGNPLTPLPQDWSWFNATPAKANLPLYTLATNSAEHAEAVAKAVGADDYPWEKPPTVVRLPLLPAQKHAFPYNAYTHTNRLTGSTPLPYGNPAVPDGSATQMVELVPYGAANLRLACFTISK